MNNGLGHATLPMKQPFEIHSEIQLRNFDPSFCDGMDNLKLVGQHKQFLQLKHYPLNHG